MTINEYQSLAMRTLNPDLEKKDVLIRLRDVIKEFPSGDGVNRVLKGIDLDIYRGEFLVILGESGSCRARRPQAGGRKRADRPTGCCIPSSSSSTCGPTGAVCW